MKELALPADSNLFGSEATLESSEIVILPVPWEPTTSYGHGTSNAPKAIRLASHQLDFFEPQMHCNLNHQIFMLPPYKMWEDLSQKTSRKVKQYRQTENPALLKEINAHSIQLNQWVQEEVEILLNKKKKIGILGGDHSCPFGAIKAISTQFPSFGLLHVDAHHDLRDAYEGFSFSHASIMHQVITSIPQVTNLVSVGIRDFSEEEFITARDHQRIETLYDYQLKSKLFCGKSWQSICEDLINKLPSNIYISIDIDGLDAPYCPNTGTPVPGGLSFDMLIFLLETIRQSKSQIIGFDLCEVSPDPNNHLDENIGARVLHKLCSISM